MENVNTTLYNSADMLERFRNEAERLLSGNVSQQELNLTKKQIRELLHQIQMQHIELEMKNQELKLSNEEVQGQYRKFAGLYDLAPVGYFILDSSGNIEEVNSTGCSLLARKRTEIVNHQFQTFVNPEEAETFYNFLRQAFSRGGRHSCQLSLLLHSGNILYVQLEAAAVSDPSKPHHNACYLAVVNFSERRESEVKLKEANERLELALDASVAGTWQIDLRTEEISLDEFSCAIYGFENCESVRTIDTFVQMIHPNDRRKASKRFGEAISHKRDLDVEYRIVRRNGSLAHVAARGHVIENANSEMCFVGILLDITERKKLEEEAASLKAEHHKNIIATVFRTQENERRRISEALHDSVSQLLYGIKLKLQDYKKSNKDSKVYEELNSLLELAVHETRNISFELAPSILMDFGLPITIEEMVKRLHTDKLKIHTKIKGLNCRLDLNKELNLFRIIQELVNNVIKHAHATELYIDLTKRGKELYIQVTDNGVGFDFAAELGASGSGFHSIKNRLDLLNGSIDIKSETGAGTSVKIVLKDVLH